MLPKAHLTSNSRMSGSRWVITPLWLSGSLRSFLRSSSVYSYHLFLISSASIRSVPFLSFIVPIFAWNVPLVYTHTHTHAHTYIKHIYIYQGFPCGSAGKESACNAGDLDSIAGLGRSPGEGKGYPLQYPGLGIPWSRKELDTTEGLSLHFISRVYRRIHSCSRGIQSQYTLLWHLSKTSDTPPCARTVLMSIVKDQKVGCGAFPGNLHPFPPVE